MKGCQLCKKKPPAGPSVLSLNMEVYFLYIVVNIVEKLRSYTLWVISTFPASFMKKSSVTRASNLVCIRERVKPGYELYLTDMMKQAIYLTNSVILVDFKCICSRRFWQILWKMVKIGHNNQNFLFSNHVFNSLSK